MANSNGWRKDFGHLPNVILAVATIRGLFEKSHHKLVAIYQLVGFAFEGATSGTIFHRAARKDIWFWATNAAATIWIDFRHFYLSRVEKFLVISHNCFSRPLSNNYLSYVRHYFLQSPPSPHWGKSIPIDYIEAASSMKPYETIQQI